MFNIYTNTESLHYGTRNFIYTDDLFVTAKYQSFTQVERILGKKTFDELAGYYNTIILRANPDKTEVSAFLLKNKDTYISFEVEWNRVEIDNTTYHRYKEHIHNTNIKLATRN